ncbi:MAG: type I DNA topoisomerase, partial [Planctomycetota bacterium]|nr:type I DNA topoisomerase [Planctomycetota bacterium]
MSEQTKFNDDAEDASTKTVDAPKKKATKAKAKKPAVKKTAAKKPAAKTPAAKKPAAKKSPAAKDDGAKTAKKPAAKKATKKAAAKKPAAKKAAKPKAAKKSKAKSDKPGKTLVIVESPAKAKTINKYLGDNYIVKASMGHVRDLPRNDVGISIEDKFTPTYEVLADKEKIVSELKKALKKVDRIAYACDHDREGEAIAWHLSEILASKKPAMRVTFNEITKQAIERAFENPSQIDMDKVNAQQARRLLDRLVGYKLSPLLWRKVRRGLSAGRVQSVAVKIIVKRERLIQAFRAHEYWRLSAEFKESVAEDAEKFFADLHSLGGAKLDPKGFHIENEARATLIRQRLEAGTAAVSRADVKEKADRPYPPFITSTLQQAASTKLRYTTKKAMMIAQQLYEGIDLGGDLGHLGLITYMRTDSFNLAQESTDKVREYITEQFGAEYLPDKVQVYKTKKKSAQEAHEAIRPTRPELSPESIKQHLKDDQFKLYQLIWQRFVGCQMKPARYAHKTIEVKITPSDKVALASPLEGELQNDERFDGAGVFRITGKSLVFHGHALVTGVKVKKDEPLLPELPEGKTVQLSKLQDSQHFTQPPPRYTEASLVKTLEEFGIGRPSTYSAITQTIQDRKYVTQESRKLHATKLGEIVTDKLGEHFGDIMNTEFTSQMEENLDRVEDAKGDWVVLLSDF